MALILVTGPDVEPVSKAEAKLHCRVDISDDDDLITALIVAARELCETITQRALITQTWDLVMDDWPGGDVLSLPLAPLQSITSISYTDEDGNSDTFSADNYVTDTESQPGRAALKSTASWPSTTLQEIAGVRVRFVAGYGDAGSDVPQSIRQAMLLLIGHWYEQREAIVTSGAVPQEVPFAVQALLATHRMYVRPL